VAVLGAWYGGRTVHWLGHRHVRARQDHNSTLIHDVALAVSSGLTVRQVSELLHSYPTFSEGVRYACAAIAS